VSTKPLRGGAIPLRERRSLSEEWTEFERTIIPKGAPLVQRVESRRAWYAGAASMLGLVSGGLDADKEPTDLDVAYLESIHQELVAFSRDLTEGTA
jgi:hypothetical protein